MEMAASPIKNQIIPNSEDEGYANHMAEYLESCFKQGHMLACSRTLKSAHLFERNPKITALWALTCGMNGDFHFALRTLSQIHKTGDVRFTREGWFEWNQSYFQLGLGHYQDGWKNYEFGRILGTRPTRTQGEQWDGSYLGPDKTISVWTEQGTGDTFQFIRFLRRIKEKSGARLVLETSPPLTAFLRKQSVVAETCEIVCPIEKETPAVAYDFHMPLMSAGSILGLNADDDMRQDEPYLHAEKWMADNAEEMFANDAAIGSKLRVGLVWAGSEAHRNNAQRSIAPEFLEPFKSIVNTHWISLQTGKLPCPEWCHDIGKDLQVWIQTAAVISALDVVVCCDTAVAHLAAAMGKKVLMMVSAGPCWRWKQSGSVTPWYPTLTIYRQPSLYDWESVVKSVSEDIERLAVEKARR